MLFDSFVSGAKNILPFVFCSLFLVAGAQTPLIDSLRRALPTLSGRDQVDCLNAIALEYGSPYLSISKYTRTDSAIHYALRARALSQASGYLRGLGLSYFMEANAEEQRGHFNTDEQLLLRALPLLEQTGSTVDIERTRLGLGWCAFVEARYEEALTRYARAESYFATQKDSAILAMIYRMTGN